MQYNIFFLPQFSNLFYVRWVCIAHNLLLIMFIVDYFNRNIYRIVKRVKQVSSLFHSLGFPTLFFRTCAFSYSFGLANLFKNGFIWFCEGFFLFYQIQTHLLLRWILMKPFHIVLCASVSYINLNPLYNLQQWRAS